uniref:Uncharacterized protein n=1 Tax=Oryza barthii TaxID=65489 RepID=A0A0D3EKX4_9ORYZ
MEQKSGVGINKISHVKGSLAGSIDSRNKGKERRLTYHDSHINRLPALHLWNGNLHPNQSPAPSHGMIRVLEIR